MYLGYEVVTTNLVLHGLLGGGGQGGEPRTKGERRCTGGGRKGGKKCDSQGGGKQEKQGEIMQHCVIFSIEKGQIGGSQPK